MKAQDRVLGAIGFEHESRRDDTSAKVGLNRSTNPNSGKRESILRNRRFQRCRPSGTRMVFVADFGAFRKGAKNDS